LNDISVKSNKDDEIIYDLFESYNLFNLLNQKFNTLLHNNSTSKKISIINNAQSNLTFNIQHITKKRIRRLIFFKQDIDSYNILEFVILTKIVNWKVVV
jgi:hypothetical protein